MLKNEKKAQFLKKCTYFSPNAALAPTNTYKCNKIAFQK
jgi:hypothetical protein